MHDVGSPTECVSIAHASLPYAVPRVSLPDLVRQFVCLVEIMLAEYRTTWFYHTFFGTLLPVGLLFFFTIIQPKMVGTQALFLLTGNMATSIAYGPTQMLIAKIGWGRHAREFDYWATLPVPKLSLILAIVLVYILFAFPGLISSYVIGCWLLDLPFSRGLALLPFVPLAALSMAGLGAVLGTYARDGQTATIFGQSLLGVVTFLAPALVPPEALPQPLRFLIWCIPTTYVAALFREVLEGRYGEVLLRNVLILLVISMGFLTLAHHKLDWRAA